MTILYWLCVLYNKILCKKHKDHDYDFNYNDDSHDTNIIVPYVSYNKLRDILYSANCNHKIAIMKETTLKDAHIYCKINQLSGQLSGTLIEQYFINKYNMSKNEASLCIGDAHYKRTNVEIKISCGGFRHNQFNYVQLRVNHNCDYILTAYYISYDNIDYNGELFIFKISKPNIKKIIYKYGSYAHGTKNILGNITNADLNNTKNTKEYAIRPKSGDECWCKLLKYRVYIL